MSRLTRLQWQAQRLRHLVTGGLRSLQQRGLLATLAHIPRRLGWGAARGNNLIDNGIAHVLIIDAQIPDPTRDSGSVRLLAICRLLQARGLAVAFVPHSGTADPVERQRLDDAGIMLVGAHGSPNLPEWLKQRRADIKAVMLCRHTVASSHLPLIRGLLPDVPVAFDTVDLHYLREQRSAEQNQDRAAMLAAGRTREAELELVAQCQVTYVVSKVEADVLRQACPQARIHVLSNIHELQPPGPGPEHRHGALFVGGWGHPPNQDAVAWLCRDIWPLVREQSADCCLHLVGDIPQEVARQLARIPNITVHGRVADLKPLMDQCRIALAPLRVGAGVKGKVNSAMSHGLPVVATTIAAEGMFITPGTDALIADDTHATAAAIVRLEQDDALWNALSNAGRRNVQQHFSAEAADRALQQWLPVATEAGR